MNRKPSVFIGSSSAGLRVAYAIQQELTHIAATTVWSQGAFNPTRVPIENLFATLESADFAVFVFLHEDRGEIREQNVLFVRDNVIFEAGLFLAKLGRDRVFFVAPTVEWIAQLHLPSDFAGLTPSTFDPTTGNDQAAVAPALYHLKTAIAAFHKGQKDRVVCDTGSNSSEHDFVGRNSHVYKGREIASELSKGELHVLADGAFHLERGNLEGRYEIELRPSGPKKPSLSKAIDMPERVLRVSCEAKVEGGEHSVRFVWKDIENDKWVADKSVTVKNADWTKFEFQARIPAFLDLLFRIDDLTPSKAPSHLYLRKLKIVDTLP